MNNTHYKGYTSTSASTSTATYRITYAARSHADLRTKARAGTRHSFLLQNFLTAAGRREISRCHQKRLRSPGERLEGSCRELLVII